MSDIAIRAQELSKRYRISTRLPYKALRDTITDGIYAPFRAMRYLVARKPQAGQESSPGTDGGFVWALRDVSFEVKQGEAVGIIGRNGVGKTTLLKVLSRVTEPTRGWAEVRGRVGSLLEVGAGFHPELTGRENVHFNGAILGMTRRELSRKFNEIVAFAELERFIDTPVKRYSSGMYMRLAFAVAAHLDPEILLVDEVLAVGDASFQKRCLGKMGEVAAGGRTVLFVSHNMPAITRLCQRTILLDAGCVVLDGPSPEVVSTYLQSGIGTTAAREWPDLAKAPGDDVVRLRAVRLVTPQGAIKRTVNIQETIGVQIEYEIMTPGRRLSPVIVCYNEEGVCLFASGIASRDALYGQDPSFVGKRVATCWIPGNFLAEGTMTFTVSVNAILGGNYAHTVERDAVQVQVVDPVDAESVRGLYGGTVAGVVRPMLRWTTESDQPPSGCSLGEQNEKGAEGLGPL